MKKTSPLCPLCRHPQTEFLFNKNERGYFNCLNCKLKFVWPIPSSEKLTEFYRDNYWQKKKYRGDEGALGYLSYDEEKDSFLDYFGKILDQVRKKSFRLAGKVLDIGCGYGYFLKVAQDYGLSVFGIDLSPDSVNEANKWLGVKTIDNKNIFDAQYPDNYFDLITIFQTLEHVGEPGKFLEETKRILKPGGLVILSTPDAGGLQVRLMQSSWFSYRHPDHLYFYNYSNLSFLLNRSGFVKIERISDPARKYPINYLLENLKYYRRDKLLLRGAGIIKKVLGPLGASRISIPLDSLVVLAFKE